MHTLRDLAGVLLGVGISGLLATILALAALRYVSILPTDENRSGVLPTWAACAVYVSFGLCVAGLALVAVAY